MALLSRRFRNELSYFDQTEFVVRKTPIFARPIEEHSNERTRFWNGVIEGPADSPYAGYCFHLVIYFPEDFPFKPPNIRFVTKIYHANVFNASERFSGKICIKILEEDWSPTITLFGVLLSIYAILKCPSTEHAVDPECANLYHNSRIEFDDLARRCTCLHGLRSQDVREVIDLSLPLGKSLTAIAEAKRQNSDLMRAMEIMTELPTEEPLQPWEGLRSAQWPSGSHLKSQIKDGSVLADSHTVIDHSRFSFSSSELQESHKRPPPSTGRDESKKRASAPFHVALLTAAPVSARRIPPSILTFAEVDERVMKPAEAEVSTATGRSRQFAARLLAVRGWDCRAVIRDWSTACGDGAAAAAPGGCVCGRCALLRDAGLAPPAAPAAAAAAVSCDICLDALDDDLGSGARPLRELECGHKVHDECLELCAGVWLAGAEQSRRETLRGCADCPAGRCAFPLAVAPPATLWDEAFARRPGVVRGWRAAASGAVAEGAADARTSAKRWLPGAAAADGFEWPGVDGEAMWEQLRYVRARRAQMVGEAGDGGAGYFACPGAGCGAVVLAAAGGSCSARDAPCGMCGRRYCPACRQRWHAPVPCAAAAAWRRFLDCRLLPARPAAAAGGDCGRLADLADGERRAAVVRRAADAVALLALLDLDRRAVAAASLALHDTGADAGTASVAAVAAALEGPVGAVRLGPGPLESAWERASVARDEVLAAAAAAEAAIAELGLPDVDPDGVLPYGTLLQGDPAAEVAEAVAAMLASARSSGGVGDGAAGGGRAAFIGDQDQEFAEDRDLVSWDPLLGWVSWVGGGGSDRFIRVFRGGGGSGSIVFDLRDEVCRLGSLGLLLAAAGSDKGSSAAEEGAALAATAMVRLRALMRAEGRAMIYLHGQREAPDWPARARPVRLRVTEVVARLDREGTALARVLKADRQLLRGGTAGNLVEAAAAATAGRASELFVAEVLARAAGSGGASVGESGMAMGRRVARLVVRAFEADPAALLGATPGFSDPTRGVQVCGRNMDGGQAPAEPRRRRAPADSEQKEVGTARSSLVWESPSALDTDGVPSSNGQAGTGGRTGSAKREEELAAALDEVDWAAVARCAGGGLSYEDIDLLARGKGGPEARAQRAAERRAREEKETARLLRATAKACPGSLPGGAACEAPCQRASGCNTVVCAACGAAWCWRCRAIKLPSSGGGGGVEAEARRVQEADAAVMTCKCTLFQEDDDPVAAAAGYEAVRAEALNRSEARSSRGGIGGNMVRLAGAEMSSAQEAIVLSERLHCCHALPKEAAEAALIWIVDNLRIHARSCPCIRVAPNDSPATDYGPAAKLAAAAAVVQRAGTLLAELRPRLELVSVPMFVAGGQSGDGDEVDRETEGLETDEGRGRLAWDEPLVDPEVAARAMILSSVQAAVIALTNDARHLPLALAARTAQESRVSVQDSEEAGVAAETTAAESISRGELPPLCRFVEHAREMANEDALEEKAAAAGAKGGAPMASVLQGAASVMRLGLEALAWADADAALRAIVHIAVGDGIYDWDAGGLASGGFELELLAELEGALEPVS
jgi:ubiquitin-conjugating enzyme E2 D